jgi:mannose-6-phosphate isomerase-like protein (cupin superfamily)
MSASAQKQTVVKVVKPWGHELIFAHDAKRYAGKILVIEKGKRLSLQYHRRKTETVYVLKGKLTVRLGTSTRVAGPGSAFTVPVKTVHRFESHHGRVTLVEVSTPELDDVVRLEDDYGRSGEK